MLFFIFLDFYFLEAKFKNWYRNFCSPFVPEASDTCLITVGQKL